MLWATRRSLWPGSSLMRAEQEPEPIACLVLVLFRASSKSSRSPEICNRLRRVRVPEGYHACWECHYIPISQKRKLRHWEVGRPVRGHVARKWQGWYWNPGLSDYKVCGTFPCPIHSGGGTYRNPKGLMVNFPVGKVTLPS